MAPVPVVVQGFEPYGYTGSLELSPADFVKAVADDPDMGPSVHLLGLRPVTLWEVYVVEDPNAELTDRDKVPCTTTVSARVIRDGMYVFLKRRPAPGAAAVSSLAALVPALAKLAESLPALTKLAECAPDLAKLADAAPALAMLANAVERPRDEEIRTFTSSCVLPRGAGSKPEEPHSPHCEVVKPVPSRPPAGDPVNKSPDEEQRASPAPVSSFRHDHGVTAFVRAARF